MGGVIGRALLGGYFLPAPAGVLTVICAAMPSDAISRRFRAPLGGKLSAGLPMEYVNAVLDAPVFIHGAAPGPGTLVIDRCGTDYLGTSDMALGIAARILVESFSVALEQQAEGNGHL